MSTSATQSEIVQIDFSNELLSSSELFQSRSRSHKIPLRGQKEFLPNDSKQQKACLQKILDEHWMIVNEERVERVGNLVNAEWIPEEKIVKLQSQAGKFWQTMGFSDQGKQCLDPEEALYLMECGNVQVFYQDLPLSVQEGYEGFLSAETVTYLQYQVFGHLKRLGYVVNRYDNRLGKQLKRKLSQSPSSRLCNKKSSASPALSAGQHEGENKTNVQYNSTTGAPGRNWWTNKQSKLHPDSFQPSERYWDFSCIFFPDLGSHDSNSACLPPPDPSLLPGALQVPECNLAHWHRNLNMQKERRSKQTQAQNGHICNIKDDQMVYQCKNWVEYLKLVEERKSHQHGERPTHLQNNEVVPLAHTRKCSSHRELLDHIHIIQSYESSEKNPRLPVSEQWRITFNVYQPDPKFKKSCPGKPYTRLCVCSFDGAVPDLHVLKQLSIQSGDVPMTYAVVDHGAVSFYSFKEFKLPTDVY